MNTGEVIDNLFNKYYHDNPELLRIVYVHSQMVADKALKILQTQKLPLNPEDVYAAAMLHDIGVVKCKANDIHAFGNLPYLQHGIEGEKILKENGLDKFASVCLTHTGAGISAKDIRENKLPLPEIDLIPKSLLEKLICYADKFYSKSGDLKKEKNLNDVIEQMKKFGPESLQRFLEMNSLFNSNFAPTD